MDDTYAVVGLDFSDIISVVLRMIQILMFNFLFIPVLIRKAKMTVAAGRIALHTIITIILTIIKGTHQRGNPSFSQ
jgi:tryptophan-rich sensory protein